jgi:hypothetical protein
MYLYLKMFFSHLSKYPLTGTWKNIVNLQMKTMDRIQDMGLALTNIEIKSHDAEIKSKTC